MEGGKGGAVATSKFSVPVDSENKSTSLKLWKIKGSPHNMAFHLSWFAFFCAFFSTFAAAALMPIIRDDLNLNKVDIGNSGIASVVGAIFSRIVMGSFMDLHGARWGISFLILMTCAPIFLMSIVTSATGFIIVRLFIGFSLASFVGSQYWCSSMFNTRIVGTANALSAGWGNLGGGAVQLIMPFIALGLGNHMPMHTAWRWSFFFPAFMQLFSGIFVLVLGQDLPDGQMAELRREGTLAKNTGGINNWKAAVLNYRTWVYTLCYGYCFGVELTVDNVITQYLFDQFALNLEIAGLLGGIFGMMNIFSRPSGGVFSDVFAKRYGIRGRMWSLWVVQTLGGIFCLLLGTGIVSGSLTTTLVVLVIFSIFVQQACGFSFGVVPFVSKRSTGLVSGFVGSGGNAGSALTLAVFFTNSTLTVPEGFFWMGVLIIAVTALMFLVYFPMAGWGGMLCSGKEGVTEEDYYMSEYTAEERAAGMHTPSLKFAFESRSQRGSQRGQEVEKVQAVNDSVKSVTATTAV